MQGKAEICAHDIRAEVVLFDGGLDGYFKMLDGEWIFGPAVDVAFIRAHGIGADEHSFDDPVGIAFQHTAIHEGTWVTLIRIADHIFLGSRLFKDKVPFESGGKASSASAAQTGGFHAVYHGIRSHGERLFQGLIATGFLIFIYALRVDHATVFEHDTHLRIHQRIVLGLMLICED